MSLRLSKCHIFGNHMSRLIWSIIQVVSSVSTSLSYIGRTLCMLGNFSNVLQSQRFFFIINFFKKYFLEYTIKGYRSGLMFCHANLICIKSVCNGNYQHLALADKELIKKLLLFCLFYLI